MKRVYILLVCILLLPKLMWAQYYIRLNKENTFHYGNNYLIDVPIKFKHFHTTLFIQDPNALIPIRAYYNLLNTNIKSANVRFIDTVFVSRNRQVGEAGLQLIALQKSITEYFAIQDRSKDTLVNIDNRFRQYKQLQKEDKKDSVLVYYYEYGSDKECCLTESAYQKTLNNRTLEKFIHLFEENHHVKIGDVYVVHFGDEGEWEKDLTLSGLTAEQKIKFIDERRNTLISNRKDLNQAIIYTPFWIPINELKEYRAIRINY